MTRLNLFVPLLVAATVLAGCSVNESGNIPCDDVRNCPSDYPTCSSKGFCVPSAPAAKIEIVGGDAQTGVSGSTLSAPLVVRVRDTNDNPVAGFGVSWTASSGGSVSSGTTQTGPDGTAQITATLGSTNGVYTFTATATATGLTGSPLHFTATGGSGPAASYALTGPTTTVAGVAQTYTLTVKDANGNVAIGYSGTATFTSNDPQAALPAAHVFTASEAGIFQFNAILKTSGAAQTVAAADGSLSASVSAVVSPAAAATLSVTGFTSPISADNTSSFTTKALDAFGNVATSYRGTVHFTSDNTLATLPANYTFTSGDNGVHVFTGAKLSQASSVVTFKITATDTVTASIIGSQQPITVNPGAAATFAVFGFPNPVNAGATGNFIVTARDAFGNSVTGYRGTAHFSTDNGAGATLPPDYTFTSNDLGTHTFSAILTTASAAVTYSITVTDTVTASITGSQSGVQVNPATAAVFVVTTTALNPQTAGANFNVTVTARDTLGNTATSYTGTVHFTSSDGQAVLPADSTLTNGTKTFNNLKLKTSGSHTVTVTDTVTATLTGVSPSINVAPAATSTILVNPQGSTQIAGVAFNVVVTAKDTFGNTTPAYAGTLHFTSTDGQAVLPSDTTLTSGTSTLLATFKTVGSQTITATDTGAPGINGTSLPVPVNPAATSTFAFSAIGAQTAGTAFTITVTAKDAFGNTTPTYAGTVHFTSATDPQVVVPADSTLISGTKTFTNGFTLKTAGTTQKITATDTVTVSITGTTPNITVNPAAASTFTVSTTAGAPQTAGAPFDMTVTAKDQFGNTATGYVGTVHFAAPTDPLAIVPANSTLTSGTKTFLLGVTLKTAGTQTITATDTASAGITGSSPTINVAPAATSTFTVSAASPQIAGTPFDVTVTAKDQFGNPTPGYLGTVHLSSLTDGLATFAADSTLPGGTKTFLGGATLKTVGSQTIRATDTVSAGIFGTSSGITVNPGSATNFLVAATSPQTSGVAFNVTVTARDAFNNTATGYNGTVHFTTTDTQPGVIVPPDSTLISGVKTFTGGVTLLTAAGPWKVTATDTVNGGITGDSPSITVNFGAITSFVVLASSPQTSGSPFDVTVTAKDPGGNTITNYAGTVVFTSTDTNPGIVVPVGQTLPGGSKTFVGGVTLQTAGSQTITVKDSVTTSAQGTSPSITVNPGSTTQLALSGHPQSVVVDYPNSITVTAKDAAGNTTPAYTGTVHFAVNNSAGSTVPGNYTFVSGDNGAHTFDSGIKMHTAVVLNAQIVVNDTAGGGITNGTQNLITVVPAPLVLQSASALIASGPHANEIFITGGSTATDDSVTGSRNTYFFKPAGGSGSMLPGPGLQVGRYAHVAIALSDGKVIIGGGDYTTSTAQTEFEVCDTTLTPPTCVTSGGINNASRCRAAGALVSATRILLAGGDNCGHGTNTAKQTIDIWDNGTTTALTTATHILTTGRVNFTATPVGGAAGSEKILLAGGASTATADVFTNNATAANATVASTALTMNAVRSGHTATLLPTGTPAGSACDTVGPCVLIVGGFTSATATTKTWEIYDGSLAPASAFSRVTTPAHELNVPRQFHVAGKFNNGRVAVSGGLNSAAADATTETFDPTALVSAVTWGIGTGLTTGRNKASGVHAPNQDLLNVIGGSTSALPAAAPGVDQIISP